MIEWNFENTYYLAAIITASILIIMFFLFRKDR